MLASDQPPSAPTISEQHFAELAASAITPEAAIAAGVYTETDPAKIAKLLNWQRSAEELGPCLVFPYLSVSGSSLGYCRVKPTKPRISRQDGEQKPIKYEAPVGKPNEAYLPPNTRAVLGDVSYPLIITEGEKKAISADTAGYHTVGISGVWAWQQKRERNANNKPIGDRELLPNLEAIPWQGRTVYVAFDSDWRTNRLAQIAVIELAKVLTDKGAYVHIVDIPSGLDHKNQGINDFIVANGREAFLELLDTASPAIEYFEDNPLPLRSIKDPHDLADDFLRRLRNDPSCRLLRHWQNEFWQYNGQCYELVSGYKLESELYGWLHTELNRRLTLLKTYSVPGWEYKPVSVTTSLARNVAAAVASRCFTPSGVRMPSWVGGATGPDPRDLLAVGNGLLDVKTSKLHPHTPQFFNTLAIPYAYDPKATCPNWLEFLQSIWPDDAGTVATLQEWFGYLLTADTRQQRMLFLVGPWQSGHKTICRVLSSMIDRDNVTNLLLSNLTLDFELQPLIGRTVAIITYAIFRGHRNKNVVIKRLLSLCATRLATRFVLATDELPRLIRKSEGSNDQLMVIRLAKPFRGEEGRDLEDRLTQELPGILNWSLEGLRRLRERGRFQHYS